ncbi:replicative DNA helicase [Merdimmobilis hominis]|uniref:replicative DNA helicase n=1 Tax=Merdimmobilis hominis TaxID=2897707 RepID=UPI000D7B1BB9|nr:replicative DNA helicase [uncultured Merdimmobilis sp.]PWL56558.1 MAG: replicative DNA helicase [Oscillospiraceae bacterium]
MEAVGITEQLYTQQLPYSLEAEQSVLGAILIDPACITRVMEYIKPESFYRPQHQELFSVLTRMFVSSQTIDFITVLEMAKREGIFDTDEDAKIYLTQLAQIVPSTANVESYAKIVQEKSYIRSLILASQKVIDLSRDGSTDARTLLDMAEQSIFDIRQGRDASGLTRIDEIILQTYDRLQKLSGEDKEKYMGLPTGFAALDSIITGLNRTDLILVAARPGMGKTAFGLNIAANVATKTGKQVAVFSLEMGKEQLVTRLLSSEALIQSGSLRTGNLKPDDWVKLAMSAQVLSQAPIYIDDTPGITVAEMKAKLRRFRDLGLVVIDYLQLMSTGKRSENRVQEVSEITRSLKIMAKELNVPVITLSQLSRGPESRTDHRPMLSDLRESGSIEQDADIVMFLYREAYYNRECEEQNTAECIVAKNRHGETDSVKMGWDGQFTRFKSLEYFRNEP